VGLAKTGTHSLASIFGKHYRSGHEVDNRHLVPLACEFYGSAIPQPRVLRELLVKDVVYNLEMDSNAVNAYFVREILQLFPDAKFILPVRDPESWLSSIVNHMISKETTDEWESFRVVRFGHLAERYPPEEAWLHSIGVPTISTLLQYWTYHNRFVTTHVPKDNLLVIRTEEIESSLGEIASFLGIEAALLDAQRAHVYKARYRSRLSDHVPSEYVSALVSTHCTDLFPER
jgi:hypothetical protein